ncbi:MAG: hypothetical protein A2Y14_01465 [Verrucomicrobia bacterium GWF2_51_19]|nr:MAG: hypothetical protein A2Y14_01465 [Verrucomicrobia bacterium GWF2_51_19]
MVAGDASVSSVFQNWIDGPAKKANLIVAIAGSSQRMMHAIVLSKSAPLYGRAQSILKIEALGFEHLHFLNHPSATDCVKFYSAFGGIPRYWELAQGVGTNVEGKIDELILDPMGVLHMEGKQLLLEEYKNSQLLKSVLEAIGSGSHRPSEVAARLNMKQTSLSLAFTQLMEMDFVTREVPFGEKESSKKALYKIKDPFLRFWYKIVSPNQSFLTYASKTQRVALLKKHFPSLCALGWEAICRDQIVKMEAVVTEAGRFWRKSELEWDLVCETEDALILGECKWSENILQRDKWLKHIKAMLVKPTPFATQKKIRYMLFVPEAKSIDNDLVEIVTLAHMQNVTA